MTPRREDYAQRAAEAYAAMERGFGRRRDAMYRRDGGFHLPGTVAHLWPHARAFVATLDLAGVPAGLVDDFDAAGAIEQRLTALERYWDVRGPWPAYASDPPGARFGGDRYYDDNAWVGLGLIQLARMRPGQGRLDRVAQLWAFAAHGWDGRADQPAPGGVFWLEQGRGTGRRNHDRNTVSTAPNAQVGLHLAELTELPELPELPEPPEPPKAPERPERPEPPGPPEPSEAVPPGPAGPGDMHDWVERTLATGTGLYWDKIRGDGSIDRAEWSYNQGNMVGLKVLLARARSDRAYLEQAETVARAALARYAGAYERQPAAFNAILFRNLLQLHAATADEHLRRDVLTALREYADLVGRAGRDRHGCARLTDGRSTLLDQSAVVSVNALLAWDPEDYGRLA